ncbi:MULTISPECIES: DUF4013 domain-containing protein [unclassified Methanobrevibacter]|jgi:hypothetical protein|uniref:DUF4013 domain-containing protein n=1 Tax=unclassified Methanobrevibacter TaxID=2638681 RepID=UPI0039B977EC
MSVTDVLKESLHYPFIEKEKIIILGIFYALISAINLGISYLISTPLMTSSSSTLINETATTFYQQINHIFAQIPTTNLYESIILGIVMILLGILATGYDYRVIKEAINKNNFLPKFNNFLLMFIEGLKITVVEIAYDILPIILLVTGFYIMTYGGIFLTIGSILSCVGIICAILMVLIQIMAINHMIANDGKITFAFKVKDILNIINSISWIRYIGALFMLVIICVIIGIAASMIISFIMLGVMMISSQVILTSLVTLVIMGLFITPFLSLFCDRTLGSLYNERVKDLNVDEKYIIK